MCEIPGNLLSSTSTHVYGDHVYRRRGGAFLVVVGFEAVVRCGRILRTSRIDNTPSPFPNCIHIVTWPANDDLPPSVIIVLVVLHDEATWVRVLQRFSGIRPRLRHT